MNVGYYERKQGGAKPDGWAHWDDTGWLSLRTQLGGVTPQRLAVYPDQIARGDGVDANVRTSSGGEPR